MKNGIKLNTPRSVYNGTAGHEVRRTINYSPHAGAMKVENIARREGRIFRNLGENLIELRLRVRINKGDETGRSRIFPRDYTRFIIFLYVIPVYLHAFTTKYDF